MFELVDSAPQCAMIKVIGVEGRAISFEALVKDTVEEVGRGKHNRFIVDVAKTFNRLTAKREKIFGS